MIERSIRAAALSCMAVLLASPAAAQSIDSPYRFVEGSHAIWAFGGAVFTDRGTIDIGPGSGYAAGLGYNLRISGPFNLGVRAAYFPTDRRVYDDTSAPADSVELRADPMFGLEQVGRAELSLVVLDASLRFDITGPRTWYRLQPYALIGAGGVLVASQDNTAEEALPQDLELRVRFRNGFTGHVGGGVEVHVSEHFTLRLDARDVLWKIHVPQDFRTSGRVIDDEQWVQTAHLSLGLNVRF